MLGFVMLGLVAGWGAYRLMASKGFVSEHTVKAKAKQMWGRVEQTMGQAREWVAAAEGEIETVGGDAKEKIAEIKANAQATIKAATS